MVSLRSIFIIKMTEFLNFSHFRSLGTLGHLLLGFAVHKRGYFTHNSLIKHDGKQIRHKCDHPGFRDVCAVAETQFVLGSHAGWRFKNVVWPGYHAALTGSADHHFRYNPYFLQSFPSRPQRRIWSVYICHQVSGQQSAENPADGCRWPRIAGFL